MNNLSRTIALLISTLLMVSCGRPLEHMRAELRSSGWDLWYPAEAEVEAGDIWGFANGRRDLIAKRPSDLALVPPRAIRFRSLESSVDFTGALGGSGNLGPFAVGSPSAKILKKDSESVRLKFGDTFVERIAIDDISAHSPQLPQAYRQHIADIQAGSKEKKLLTSVVRSAGMEYVVIAKDSFDASAAAKLLENELGVKVTMAVSSDRTYTFQTASDRPLVIAAGELSSPAFLSTESSHSNSPSPNRPSSQALTKLSSQALTKLKLASISINSRSRREAGLVPTTDSEWFWLALPPDAEYIYFEPEDGSSTQIQFDVGPHGLPTRMYATGIGLRERIGVSQLRGQRLPMQVFNVCDGPDDTLDVSVFVECDR